MKQQERIVRKRKERNFCLAFFKLPTSSTETLNLSSFLPWWMINLWYCTISGSTKQNPEPEFLILMKGLINLGDVFRQSERKFRGNFSWEGRIREMEMCCEIDNEEMIKRVVYKGVGHAFQILGKSQLAHTMTLEMLCRRFLFFFFFLTSSIFINGSWPNWTKPNRNPQTKVQQTDPNITTTWASSPKKRKPVEEGFYASHHVDERPAFWDTRQGESRPPSTGDLGRDSTELRRQAEPSRWRTVHEGTIFTVNQVTHRIYDFRKKKRLQSNPTPTIFLPRKTVIFKD